MGGCCSSPDRADGSHTPKTKNAARPNRKKIWEQSGVITLRSQGLKVCEYGVLLLAIGRKDDASFSALNLRLNKSARLLTLSLLYALLQTLPDDLRELVGSVRVLDVSGNRLTTLPDWLREATNLRRIVVSRNVLTELPDWLGELTSLKVLDASENRLVALPGTLEGASLEQLQLNGNSLSSLPGSIGDLKSLQKLDVSGTVEDEWDLGRVLVT